MSFVANYSVCTQKQHQKEFEIRLKRLRVVFTTTGVTYREEDILGYESKKMYIFPQIRLSKKALLVPFRKSFVPFKELSFDVICQECDLNLAYEVAKETLQNQLDKWKMDVERLERLL